MWTNPSIFLKIKGATASWNESPLYPGGSANGYKQFWKVFNQNGDKIKALKSTSFYSLMEAKGISKIDNNASVFIDEFTNINIIIYK